MEIRTAICVSALFIQSITAQYYNNLAPCAYYSKSNQPYARKPPIASYTKTFTTAGAPITITYTCPIAPSGVSLRSELAMEGQLAASGSMPFIGVVQMEGALPSSGQATVNYGCGDTVLITQEQGNPRGPNAKDTSGLTLADLANVRKLDSYS